MKQTMKIRRKDFLIFADECGISHSSAEKMISSLLSKKERFLAMCNDSFLPEHLKERFSLLMEQRMQALEAGFI